MARMTREPLVEVAFKDYAKKSKCLGYCEYHECYLTKSNIENMKCLKKNCRHFDKIKTHPFWQELERKKEEAKKRKEERKKLYETR